jgi:hypothetical protein
MKLQLGTMTKEGNMTRLNRILIGVLIVQLIVAALVFLPRTLSSEAEVEALLPGLDAAHVTALTITSGEGESITLAKKDGAWVVASAGDYPTVEGDVTTFLDKVAAIQASRLVTETPGSHKRLGVAGDDYERLVEIELDDGNTYRLYIGSSPSFGVAHVRVEGEDEVYLTPELSAQDVGTRATDWVDSTYVDLAPEEVTAFSLQNRQGTFDFAQVGEVWTMAGLSGDEVLNDSAVETLLNRATRVTLQVPLGTEEETAYGLDDPNAVVILATAGDRYTLRVGAQDAEDSSYVVAWSGSPFYVRVGEFAVRDLVEKTRDDLLQQPTPTSEPEATPGG